MLYGAEYWDAVLDFDALARFGTIDPGDPDLFSWTDTVDESFDVITRELTEHALAAPGASL